VFLIGGTLTPGPGLGVQVVPGTEATSRQEVLLDIVKWPLHPGTAVGIADGMRDKFKAVDLPEGHHLRGHHRLRATARGHHHIAVIDHAASGAAVHKAQRLEQKSLGLKAGEAREVANEDAPGIGQYQGGTLGLDAVITQLDPMRRGIELHLLPRTKVILSRTLFRRPQIGFAHPTGQGAVGDMGLMLRREDLPDPHDVAFTAHKGFFEGGQQLRWHRRFRLAGGWRRLAYRPAHAVA